MDAKKATIDAKKFQGHKDLEPIIVDCVDSDIEENSETEDYYYHPKMPSFISEIFKPLDSHDAVLKKLSDAYIIIDSLKSKLAIAEATIAEFTTAAVQKEPEPFDPKHHKNPETHVEHMGHFLNGTGASKHATNTQGGSYAAAAARTFTPASSDQGFTLFIYRLVVRNLVMLFAPNSERWVSIQPGSSIFISLPTRPCLF